MTRPRRTGIGRVDNTPQSTTAEAALDYARAGWAVLPLAQCGKVPLLRDGVNGARSDGATISKWWRQWPEANVGVSAGASGLVVVDVDGPDGARSYGEALLELGAPGDRRRPDGASVTTGRGHHLYFRAPDGVDVRPRIGWRLGVDVRAGTSYVVAPPSVHPSGATYRWLDPVPPDGLPVLASAWADAVRRLAVEEVERAPITLPPVRDGLHGTRYGQSAVAGVLRAVATAQEGGRRKALWSGTRRIHELHEGGHVPDPAPLLARIYECAARTGLPEDEITSTIAAATGAATGAPREAA